jgi:hypothetical protein
MIAKKQIRTALIAMAALVGTAALVPSAAEAHGRGGFRGGHGGGRIIVGGYFGPSFGFDYWGPYWGPYWGGYMSPYWGAPYSYAPSYDMNAAAINGMGAVDLKVKPNRAEVWVDGRYAGEARDLDGSPTYLWLKEGEHKLVISKGGYAKFETKIDVLRGNRRTLKIQLQQGPSEPAPREPGESS